LDPDGSVSDIGAFGGPDADPDAFVDVDLDGYTALLDCDDADPAIHPGVTDEPYDGIDQDCSGSDLCDVDGDGHDSEQATCGGDDCKDDDPSIYEGAPETWYDGVDSNCDNADDFDKDGDTYQSAGFGGDDCNDSDAAINPAATEVWYNGVDEDCDGN